MSEEFNVDSILDGTLDDLADMPEFKAYPVGTHRCTMNWTNKTAKKDWINGHPAYVLDLKAIETLELANTEDTPLTAGDETGIMFMLDNELGQGSFKKILTALAESFGAMSNRELIAASANAEVLVVTKQRANKEKTKSYTDVVELKVV
jgi:hypothetical protein